MKQQECLLCKHRVPFRKPPSQFACHQGFQKKETPQRFPNRFISKARLRLRDALVARGTLLLSLGADL